MGRRWTVNASPLILLGKIDHLWLLRDLSDELIVPDAVVREVGVKPEGERLLEEVLGYPSTCTVAPGAIPREVEVWDLGRGESAVIAAALVEDGSRAVVDDLEARRCAQALGLSVIGTLGVVLRAKRKGLIPAARLTLTRLREVGLYVADDLVDRALGHLGE